MSFLHVTQQSLHWPKFYCYKHDTFSVFRTASIRLRRPQTHKQVKTSSENLFVTLRTVFPVRSLLLHRLFFSARLDVTLACCMCPTTPGEARFPTDKPGTPLLLTSRKQTAKKTLLSTLKIRKMKTAFSASTKNDWCLSFVCRRKFSGCSLN